MKKLILMLVVAASVMACKGDKVKTTNAKEVDPTINTTSDETEAYSVIIDKSTLTWKGFKPTGSHNGSVGIAKGNINVAGDKLVGGKFKFDLNSIVCLDMPADNEYNAKLVGHLKSADFFDVAQFPSAVFEITDVKNVDEGKINVSGNLTVKGITKNITVPATFGLANGFASFKSDVFKIDRTEFGIEYKSMKLVEMIKDKSIDDLMEMSFDVLAQK
jgi:polyisoprenoid-binding protein YceI